MPATHESTAIAAWADSRPDLRALIQIGSRAQPAGSDQWSDYDYQLVTTRPAAYRDPAVYRPLGEPWVVALQPVFGGALKTTLILPGAIEVDFVILSALEVRLAFAALRAPGLAALWPAPLRRGVRDLRIVACPGWRIVKGGAAWQRRYARLGSSVPWPALTAADLHALNSEFWTAAVWIAKKISRGELRAAQREFHRALAEKIWQLLEHEARLQRAPARPEARRAETWLPPARVEQTGFATRPDPAALRHALRHAVAVFDEASAALARHHGWPAPDFAAVRAWVLHH